MNNVDFSIVRMRKEHHEAWVTGEVLRLDRLKDGELHLQVARDFAWEFVPGDVVQVHLHLGGCFKARIDDCEGNRYRFSILEQLDAIECEDEAESPGG